MPSFVLKGDSQHLREMYIIILSNIFYHMHLPNVWRGENLRAQLNNMPPNAFLT